MIDTTGGSNQPVITQSVPIATGRSHQIDAGPPRAEPEEAATISELEKTDAE